MGQRITQVDAFAGRAFAGNPAAVCILPEARDESWMQLLAREMNLSETAFLVPRGPGYDLRWFTPSVEVALCGHATLASAHTLWEEGHLAPEAPAVFHTKSGVLTARKSGNWIEMDFPATPASPDADLISGMEAVLGTKVLSAGRTRFDCMVEVEIEKVVRAVSPDRGKLTSLNIRGLIVTSVPAASANYDYVSRFFAPSSGVEEDPVTGSAHCCLGPFWSERLGRNDLMGYQASARGGYVRTIVRGDRVLLCGQAVTVFRGELLAAAEERHAARTATR